LIGLGCWRLRNISDQQPTTTSRSVDSESPVRINWDTHWSNLPRCVRESHGDTECCWIL